VRDQIVDYVRDWSEKTELPTGRFIAWLGITESKYHTWQHRYGKANEHNGRVPRDFWLEDWEKAAIIDFHLQHPDNGYRRLTYMMMDADVVAVAPSTVWRVLHQAGQLHRRSGKESSKGKGFDQPLAVHEHWHIDISYLNISGTFYYLCSVLDGCSRYLLHWELRESMIEAEVEVVLQRTRELYPDARPRIISDNGPQFLARDFKEFIRVAGMTHVRTSPYYPQSNGKIERWHKSLKTECIRPGTPLSLEDARRLVSRWVDEYNGVRLHSAIGYVTPAARLAGQHEQIQQQRDARLEAARQARQQKRQEQRHEKYNEKTLDLPLIPADTLIAGQNGSGHCWEATIAEG
jgi:putative transposase